MVVFRVEVALPKNLNAAKRRIVKHESSDKVFEELGEKEVICKIELRQLLIKHIPERESDINFLVYQCPFNNEGKITPAAFEDWVKDFAILESKADRRPLVQEIAREQCGTDYDSAQFIESETVAFYTFSWNTTSEGTDRVVKLLKKNKIGTPGMGSVCVYKLSSAAPLPVDHLLEGKRKEEEAKASKTMRDRVMHDYKSWWVAGRRPPFEIKSEIEAGAEMNFDYYANLYGASVIAGVGLATNSSVMVVASMLISPLMGPILAMIFGIATRDWKMACHGLLNEIWSTFHTLMGGFVIGLFLAPLSAKNYNWPTSEMAGRGTLQNFTAGIFYAAASGVILGVNVSASNGNALAGVAISASLLPPLVNSGLSLAFAALGPVVFDEGDPTDVDVPEVTDHYNPTDGGSFPMSPAEAHHVSSDLRNFAFIGYELSYKTNSGDNLVIAGWSFALYIMNVVVIGFVCWVIFKLKGYSKQDSLDWKTNNQFIDDLDTKRTTLKRMGAAMDSDGVTGSNKRGSLFSIKTSRQKSLGVDSGKSAPQELHDISEGHKENV